MKNNKDSNRITEYVVSICRPLWNVSFTYTQQFYLSAMNRKGEKQTALWSSLNLYNIFYDHLDTENIPFPYTGTTSVYTSVRGIFEFDQPVSSVSRSLVVNVTKKETKLWLHRKIHSTKTPCISSWTMN